MSFNIGGHTFYFLSDQRQWEKLWTILNTVFSDPLAIIGTVLILVSLLMTILVLGKNRKTKKYVGSFNLIIYSIALFLCLVLLQTTNSDYGIKEYTLNDYLFEGGFHETMVLISLIKLAFFVPLGFYLVWAMKEHRILRWLIVLSAAVLIEALQLLLHKGYFAVFDIVMYIVGAVIGFLICRVRSEK